LQYGFIMSMKVVKMKFLPIAFDSIGVRSMASLLRTPYHCIFIDPAVALAPRRYGIPPTKLEKYAQQLARERIMMAAEKCDVIFVSHYHYDHHPRPHDDEMYEKIFRDKIVFAKNPNENVNFSAKKRGYVFTKKVEKLCKKLFWADGVIFDDVEFSPAVWHGNENSRVGFVVMMFVSDGKVDFLYGSDAQSLGDDNAKNWVISKNPDIMVIDGFPTNFIGWRISQQNFDKASANLFEVLEKTKVKEILMDHHAIRDLNYREKLKPLFDLAKSKNKKLLTLAEYIGLENLLLEGYRKELAAETYNPKKEIDEIHEYIVDLIEKF